MVNLLIKEHIASMRDGMEKVCRITQRLGAEPNQEDLEEALLRREAILSVEVIQKAKDLSASFPDWRDRVGNDSGLKKLFGEAQELMRSIMIKDEALSKTLKRRMSEVEAKLSSLYKTSRAASSYTAQSTLRAGK